MVISSEKRVWRWPAPRRALVFPPSCARVFPDGTVASIPLGLRASRAVIGGAEVAVFSFPPPPPELPRSLGAAGRIVALTLILATAHASAHPPHGCAKR